MCSYTKIICDKKRIYKKIAGTNFIPAIFKEKLNTYVTKYLISHCLLYLLNLCQL